jgi:hypothetical protein
MVYLASLGEQAEIAFVELMKRSAVFSVLLKFRERTHLG